MRIKNIEIEGFKSYSQREVIDNLDPQFNAITGLNGSGKSNILDAICFLLGISNLSNVRAHSLTDLVYKQGQAGVNRATVTITFDNNVPLDQQPAGYSKYKEIVVRRQVIINGRNTYQINGTAATNQRVTDLFRMVGINVNNPHFLIMQGRITKVLNMKPMEILSMVEEAAGVRMYECKKQNALKTIEKKESKVQEISRLIDEDILPRVERLKKDRNNYLEYQQVEKKLEELERKLHAYDYYNSMFQIGELETKSNAIRLEMQQITDDIDGLQDTMRDEQEIYERMQAEKAKNVGPEVKNLENALKQRQNEQAQIESERDGLRFAISESQTAIDRKTKSLDNDKKDLQKKIKQLKKAESESGNEEQRGKAAEQALIKARQKLEALALGMITDDAGNMVSLEAQLTAIRTKLSERETNIKKAEMRRDQLQNTLKNKRIELQQIKRHSFEHQDAREKLLQEIGQIEYELSAMNFNPNIEQQLEEERRQLNRERGELARELDQFEAKYYHLQFNYKDPHPGFNRERVKGIVAKLFRLKDPKFALALEIVGGGRIYNIVIDNAETGKILLEKKCIQNRVTMLPLDKIRADGILTKRQIQEAKRMVGAENVYIPSELIEYDLEYEPVINYVFGRALICTKMEQAKQLTYENQNVSCRTVTLDGDDFQPTGLLTGGSRSQNVPVLQRLFEVSAHYARVTAIDQRLQSINDEILACHSIRQKFDELQSKLGTNKKRLDAANEALKRSPLEVLKTEIAHLEEELSETNIAIRTDEPEVDMLKKQIKDLEEQKKDKNFQENENKRAEEQLTNAQKVLEQLKGTFIQARELLASLREEITTLEQTINEERLELNRMLHTKEEKRVEIEIFNNKVVEANEKVTEAQRALDLYNKEIRQQDKITRAKGAEIEDLKRKIRQLENKYHSKEVDAEEAIKSSKEFAKRAQQLEKVHKWILEEKDKFGKSETIYDFRNYTFATAKKEIESLRDRSKELSQTVNTRAMHLLDTAEEQYRELEIKRAQLEKDKKQLRDAIDQLDERKKRELIAAHRQISDDLRSIYSTLLPGASAELIPPQGAENCLSGFEVRVAFNGKYKDSLTELSGGQRSLVALSLILAMLKFKPAPFYILDEIDAALDLSHTENIGKMIKNHFSQSQFIVVSLKQGFFENANVIYRVQFKDGHSVVTRN